MRSDAPMAEDRNVPCPDPVEPPVVQPLALRAEEAAKALGIGKTTLWSMTNRGEIPVVRIGRRVLYPIAALQEYLARRAKGGRS